MNQHTATWNNVRHVTYQALPTVNIIGSNGSLTFPTADSAWHDDRNTESAHGDRES